MGKRMGAIVLIFLGLTAAWFTLAGSLEVRTRASSGALRGRVAALWGDTEEQVSPQLTFRWPETVTKTERVVEP